MKNPEMKINRNEDISISAQTITAKELEDLIYKKTSFPQDKRFMPEEEGGVFHYFSPTDVFEGQERKFYSIIKDTNNIIGLCELEKSPFSYEEKTFWLKFFSIDPEYQNKGHSRKLAEEVFKFVKEQGYKIQGSQYSEQGKEKLRELFNEMAQKYAVDFIDKRK